MPKVKIGLIQGGFRSAFDEKKLEIFTAGYNSFSGSIPSGIVNLVAMPALHFQYNCLSGTIPAGIGNMTKLQYVELFNNYAMTGTLPTSIGQLSLLKLLQVQNTNLGTCYLFHQLHTL